MRVQLCNQSIRSSMDGMYQNPKQCQEHTAWNHWGDGNAQGSSVPFFSTYDVSGLIDLYHIRSHEKAPLILTIGDHD